MPAARRLECLLFASAVLCSCLPALAEQVAAPETTDAAPSIDRRAENTARLRDAQQRLEANPADAAANELVTLCKTAETIFAQQDAVDQQIADLEARQQELREQLRTSPADVGRGCSFIEFDRLVNELAAERARIDLTAAKVKTAKSALDQALAEFDAREKLKRQALEAAEVGKNGPEAAALAAAADLATQSSAVAADAVALRQKEVEREKLANAVQGLTVDVLAKKVEHLRPLVVFAQSDLDEQLKKLAAQEEKLRAALAKAETSLPAIQARWADAKARHEAAIDDKQPVAEELEAWRREKEKLQEQINTHLVQLLQVDQLRTAWNRLYRVLSRSPEPTAEELSSWSDETSAALKDLIGSTQGHLFRIEELRNELATIADKAEAAKDGPPDVLRWIERQRSSVEAMVRLHEANLVSIDASRRLHGKLRTEIDKGAKLLSPAQWASHAMSELEWLWNFELTSTVVNGIPRVLTVGRAVSVLAALVAGLVLSRSVSGLLAHHLLRRFRLSRDATSIIRTLTFYTLLVIITITALHHLNVPLTAFTIVGGALAIGVGFGSQALVNNFISGLIMLAERPVRIGERVVFNRYDGVVEDVGFRCTRLRTGADHVVIIPNSSLVNESIENIGRRRTIQRTLNLAITYDTPRERIAEAVEAIRAALEEPGLREPIHPVIGWDKLSPRVFFSDFNSESLNIQVVYHFAPPDPNDFLEHAQRVNFRIMEEFERLGVRFAFPSRTVYLADGRGQFAARLANDAA